MRKIIFLALISFSVFYACKRDRKTDVLQNILPCSDCTYRNFTPDTIIAMPLDSLASCGIDLNNDEVADINIVLENGAEILGHNPSDIWKINLSGTNNVWLIKGPDNNGSCADPLDSAAVIDNSALMQKTVCLQNIHKGFHQNCSSFDNGGFVGFMINSEMGCYFGWIRLRVFGHDLFIYDYAICNEPYCYIKAGIH